MDENFNLNLLEEKHLKRKNFWKMFACGLFAALLSSALTIGILVYTGELSMLPKASAKAKENTPCCDFDSAMVVVRSANSKYWSLFARDVKLITDAFPAPGVSL